jgi:hypothetical protein
VTLARTASASARKCALATSVSPAFNATIAASTSSSSSAAIVGAFATLLHVPDSPPFSSALALSLATAQIPDSSPETTLLRAPAISCDLAGPVFDSRRLHNDYR